MPVASKPGRVETGELFELHDGDYSMVAYQLYWRDEKEKAHFIGMLSEKRKTPGRITPESILNWGWKTIGDRSNLSDIYFVQVKL